MAKELTSNEQEELFQAARQAWSHAYCPYSHFRVGAAVLTPGGDIYAGVNVENVSYGLTMCAERVAAVNAVSAGHTKFSAIAICSVNHIESEFQASCGACRQFLVEFGLDLDMYFIEPEGDTVKKLNLKDLLPMAFTPSKVTRGVCRGVLQSMFLQSVWIPEPFSE